MISCESVLSRVYNFVRVCPNYKQGNKIEVVVLNGVCILGFFVLNRVRVSNAQRLTYTQIWVEYPPPPPGGLGIALFERAGHKFRIVHNIYNKCKYNSGSYTIYTMNLKTTYSFPIVVSGSPLCPFY